MYARIGTHKDTLAVVVIDQAGRQVAGAQLPNTEPGFARLVQLLESWPVCRVGIEGSDNYGPGCRGSPGAHLAAGSYGRAVAAHLVAWTADEQAAMMPDAGGAGWTANLQSRSDGTVLRARSAIPVDVELL